LSTPLYLPIVFTETPLTFTTVRITTDGLALGEAEGLVDGLLLGLAEGETEALGEADGEAEGL
jgi:hypothetical protein